MTLPQASAGTFRLFVYGTLKRDGCRRRLLARERFLGERRTAPRYALYDLGAYPGLMAVEDGIAVQGELFEVDESLRPWLDDEEEAPHLFRLEQVEVEGEPGPVWSYLYQRDPAGRPRVPSGRWDNQYAGGRP